MFPMTENHSIYFLVEINTLSFDMLDLEARICVLCLLI